MFSSPPTLAVLRTGSEDELGGHVVAVHGYPGVPESQPDPDREWDYAQMPVEGIFVPTISSRLN